MIESIHVFTYIHVHVCCVHVHVYIRQLAMDEYTHVHVHVHVHQSNTDDQKSCLRGCVVLLSECVSIHIYTCTTIWAHLNLVGRFHSQTVVTAGDAIIPTCLPETHDVVLRAWPQGGTSVCPSHYEIGYLSHRLHSIVSRGTSLSQPVAYNLLYTGRREEEDTQGTVTRTDQIRNAHFVHTFQNAHPHIHTY